MLEEYGPGLGRPYADTLRQSRYPNMKELRVQHEGRPYRILFAFDPRRSAYLILGGDKTGDTNWYLDAIRNAAEVLSRLTSHDGLAAQAVGVVQRQIDGLTHLVDDLLDVSRIT